MLYYQKSGLFEITDSHKEAVAWFNAGFNINLLKADPETGELVKVASWEW